MSLDKRFAVAAFTIARFSSIIAIAYHKFFMIKHHAGLVSTYSDQSTRIKAD